MTDLDLSDLERKARDERYLADFAEWMTLQRNCSARNGTSDPMLRRAEFGLALIARVRAAESSPSQSDRMRANSARHEADYLGVELVDMRARFDAAQAHIAELEAAIRRLLVAVPPIDEPAADPDQFMDVLSTEAWDALAALRELAVRR